MLFHFSMDLKRLFRFLVLLTLSRSVLSGFCTEEVDCKLPCIKTFLFLKIFRITWKYPSMCDDKCIETKCCGGYTGEDCSQLTSDCMQNGNCLGHKQEEEYTDGCVCKREETMNQEFMGSNKRLVYVPCDTPCTRTTCSPGFTGRDCNERYDQDSSFLTQSQLNSIKDQLKIDEGYRDEIYIDSEGYPTFGIGHLITVSDPEHGQDVGTKISDVRIQDAFEADVHIATQGILKIFPNAGGFPGEVKEILVNMAFNLGEPRLKKFRKFIAAVNKADWSTAANEMVDSRWYQQVGNRAERLVERMRALDTPQDNNGGDSGCQSLSGTCQEDSFSCDGEYQSGLCSGSASRKCCVPSGGGDSGCQSIFGTCQDDSITCAGGYQSGLCSGSASRRCCLPGDDSGCQSISGTCQEDSNSCTGIYQSGLCSGSSSRRCCVPSSGSCSNVTIISRSQWGARSPKSTTNINVPVGMFYIHHTVGQTCYNVDDCSSVVRGHQNDHMDDNNWSDIGYNFLVGEDGNIYEGRGWNYVGAHTGFSEYNRKSYGASFMGNYMSTVPGPNAIQAAKNLIACGIQLGKIASDYELYGHRDVKDTLCPGDKLYDEIQTWPHYSHDHP